MTLLEALAVLLGLSVLGGIVWAARRGEFDAEAPKYEMLGLEPPAPVTRPSGRLGPVDRVVRLGLIGAAFVYAGRLGWATLGGALLSVFGGYCALTGLWGRDPLYRLLARHKHG